MKKIVILIIFTITSFTVFSQSNNLLSFMIETNVGYAIGINLDNAVLVDAKIMYPVERFGVALEAGSIFTPDEASFRFFIGPMLFLINNENWRVPIVLGFDLFHGETLYYGIGGFVSVHRRLTKHIYAGINLGITYAWNNVYDVLTGYETKKEVVDDGTGNAVFVDRQVPVFESKNHRGNYIYIRPSIAIGLQF